jgi:hypothetical protein
VRTLDAAMLTPAIVAKLGDWAGLMERKVGQARQILRHMLDGRITFTPHASRRAGGVRGLRVDQAAGRRNGVGGRE